MTQTPPEVCDGSCSSHRARAGNILYPAHSSRVRTHLELLRGGENILRVVRRIV